MSKTIDNRPEAMTREQIDEALRKLKEEKNRASDSNSWRISASCYIRVPPTWVQAEITCDRCGKKGALIIATYPEHGKPDTDIVEKYNKLAERFTALGYQAKMSYYCDECVADGEDELGPIVFTFQAPGMDQPAISYPDPERYDPRKYEQVLTFLAEFGQDNGQGEKKTRGYYEYGELQRILAPNEIDKRIHHLIHKDKRPWHRKFQEEYGTLKGNEN